MVHFENDYQYGIKQESNVYSSLQEYFGSTLEKSSNKWSKFDFYDDSSTYEMKTRKNKKTTYPTTMITANKSVQIDGKKLIFIFNFTDELCYIPFDSDEFSHFEKRMFSRANLEHDEKEHYYIPIEKLTTIKVY
jgi:hypothetical protein